MNVIKKLVSILIIIGFSLQQTACMHCCVTTDLIKQAEQPPKTVRYVDRINKVISAYINDEEKELTICVEGKLAEKTMTQQFALKTSLNVEQLKNQPSKGITYQAGKIPTIQMERHTVIPSCPEQPANTRTLMAKNINFDQYQSDFFGVSPSIFNSMQQEEKLAMAYKINNEKIHNFIENNPEQFQKFTSYNIGDPEIIRLSLPAVQKSDSVFYVSMEKPYSSQYLTYTTYPSIGVMIGQTLPLPFEREPAQRIQREHMSSLSWYTPKQEIHIINPSYFDGRHLVVFKIKEQEKIIPNQLDYSMLLLAIIADILLLPAYLISLLLYLVVYAIFWLLCSGGGCRPM